MQKIFLSVFIVAMLALGIPASAQDGSGVGYREIVFSFGAANEPLTTSIWYPPNTGDQEIYLGPFTLKGTRAAPIGPGKYGLVVISHGAMGSRLGHHGLAHLLAKNGYIVAAPDHAGDYWNDTSHSGTLENWYRRPRQLGRVIDGMLADKTFGTKIDVGRIGTIGHSIGGYTVLALAGGQPSPALLASHCGPNRDKDPEFCGYGKPGQPALPANGAARDLMKSGISVVIAVAPVGAVFGKDAFNDLTSKVAIHRLGADTVLRHPWHSENIVRGLKNRNPVYRVHNGVHHFAFLEPFPEGMRASIGEPAMDPAGFDRRSFLAKIHAEILSYLKKNL